MSASAYGHHAVHHQSHRGPSIAPNVPAGTFPPGTGITVGSHKCTIDRYLSEGGFAHVYLVRLTHAVSGSDVAVLKRVAVPDKEALAGMRTEVETMKKLKGHKQIVTYIDSHASHLKGGGYEVFLLMEYCSGGGLIDFMNTRLQNRLTEPEILHIFGDVVEGVACMHYLQPPLLHRDLKVENVLIDSHRGYKLCDFGSCSTVKPAPQTVVECRLLEEDIQKHTTLQYRSPEMIDVYRRLPIDEKSDIWALGVLLYKLCYYTTPFEEQGQLAILNASYSFPAYPVFSDRLKSLIANMLMESPRRRPNIYQVVKEVCSMRGKEVLIRNIYNAQVPAATGRPVEKHLPSLPLQSPPSIVEYQAPLPGPQAPSLPDVTPMRRGRPTKAQNSANPHSASNSAATSRTRAGGTSPQVQPSTVDPWAALDTKPFGEAQDELANRFPSVEQFSLLHDSGSKFQFGDVPSPGSSQTDFGSLVAERLAEDAFAISQPAAALLHSRERGPSEVKQPVDSVSRGITGTSRPVLYEPQPKRPVMVSTGTMTSPSQSPSPSPRYDITLQNAELTSRPSNSCMGQTAGSPVAGDQRQFQPERSRPSPLLDTDRLAAQNVTTATSSRPSLEVTRSSSAVDVPQALSRSRSVNSTNKPRPRSLYVESNLDFLRDLDSPGSTQGPSTGGIVGLQAQATGQSATSQKSVNIESNVDFLRAMETEADSVKTSHIGLVSRHVKRASMPSISLPTTKGLLAGKFGDAFKRFERNNGNGALSDSACTPSPGSGGGGGGGETNDVRSTLSTTTSGNLVVGDGIEESSWQVTSDEVPAEVKRELERRQLSQEEKRVAAAAAEYKKQMASRSRGETDTSTPSVRQTPSRNRANSIQKRVHALLNENKGPPPKTAEGYGQYTDEPHRQIQASTGNPPRSRPKGDSHRNPQSNVHRTGGPAYRPNTSELATMRLAPSIEPRGEIRLGTSTGTTPNTVQKPTPPSSELHPLTSTPAATASTLPKPNPPPKPNKLRGLAGPTTIMSGSGVPRKNEDCNGGLSSDLPVVDDDWETSFAKRYPSLSGLEAERE